MPRHLKKTPPSSLSRWFRVIISGCLMLIASVTADIASAQSAQARWVKKVFPAYTGVEVRQEDATLRAVRFSPAGIGIAVGDLGVMLRSVDGGETWTQVPSSIDAPLRDVLWLDDRRVVVIGGWCEQITGVDYGVVMSSADGGETFVRQEDQQLPSLDRFCLDQSSRNAVSTVSAAGSWSPVFLTDRFATRDGGRTWQADSNDLWTSKSATSISDLAPIDGIAVHDETQLPDGGRCAVGDCGVIWRQSSDDQTWQTVRGNDRRIGVTVLVSDPKQIPWASIAEECLVENHRLKILVIAPSIQKTLRNRLEQASMQVGAANLEVAANMTDALMHLAAHDQQVLAFDNHFNDKEEKDIYSLISLNKIRRAAEFSSGVSDQPTGEVILPTVGQLRSDFAEDVQGLIDAGAEPHNEFQASVVFHTGSSDHASRKSMARNFTAGLNLPVNCQRQKLTLSVSRNRLQVLTARTSLRTKIEKRICDASERALVGGSTEFAAIESELSQWIRRCDPADRERLIRQLYRKVMASFTGPSSSAAESAILRAAAKELPDSPLGQWSAWRDAQLQRSTELAWHTEIRLSDSLAGQIQQASHSVAVSPFKMETKTQAIPIGYGVDSVMAPDSTNLPHAIHQTSPDNSTSLRWSSHPAVLISQSSQENKPDQVDQVGRRIARDDPTLFASTESPADSIDLASGGLNLASGGLNPASGGLNPASGGLRLLRQDPAWSHLVPADSIDPENVVSRIDQRPYLDGRLNEWETLLPAMDRSGDVTTRFAHDGHYLYVATRFRAQYFETSPSQVIRDAASRDRLRWSLRLDLDRDLATSFQFMIDDAGQTSDGVNHDSSLDVTWYFASDVPEPGWVSIEAAIALADLGITKIRPGDSWFASSIVLESGEDFRSPQMPDPKFWQLLRFE
jgi:hypothetical protein